MRLQQTKAGSRASGGPQYYFHDLMDTIKGHLRRRGVCEVVLQTPYGIAATPFVAVGRDHKLGSDGSPRAGKVGHDRIQCTRGRASIGEEIRKWYGLPSNHDFERVDVEGAIHADGHFILTPINAKLRPES